MARIFAVAVGAVAVAGTVVGGVGPAAADPAGIAELPTSVTAFVGVVGTPAAPGQQLGLPVFNFSGFTQAYPSASQEMREQVTAFFAAGGQQMSIYPSASNSSADLIAAIKTTTTPVNAVAPANLLVVPALSSLKGQDYYNVANAMDTQAQSLSSIALLDLPQDVVATAKADNNAAGPIEVANTLTKTLPDASVAVLYSSPVIDPADGHVVASAGLMAGVYADSDAHSGVWATPAGDGLTLAGYTAQWIPDDTQSSDMVAAGLNSFRHSTQTNADIVWGARTLRTWDPITKYINQVRLNEHIATSVTQGLQWTAFAPDDSQTWAQIDSTVSGFLNDLDHQGAFGQIYVPQPYLVVVNNSNNSATDIAQGLINIDVEYQALAAYQYVSLPLIAHAAPGQSVL